MKCPGPVAGQRYVGAFAVFSQLGGVFEQKSSCENLPRFIEAIWLSEALSLRGCNGQQSVVASGGDLLNDDPEAVGTVAMANREGGARHNSRVTPRPSRVIVRPRSLPRRHRTAQRGHLIPLPSRSQTRLAARTEPDRAAGSSISMSPFSGRMTVSIAPIPHRERCGKWR